MNLEERLRAELERSSRSTRVGTAPSVDELSSVATGRRARNRVAAAAGAVALGAVVLIAAVVATQSDDTLVTADGGSQDAAQSTANEAPIPPADAEHDNIAPVEDGADSAADSGPTPTTTIAETDSTEVPAGEDDSTADTPEALPDDPTGGVVLDGPGGELTVSSRESAVDFAGGSGVLIVAEGSQYRGLAQKFVDNGVVQVGLASANGLDWEETQLVGVPDGATASILRPFDDGHVALFSRYDVDSQQRQTFVGTSTDLVVWDMSAPLPGDDVVATDLAVGSSGVIIIGDDTEPNVWLGPVGGPFERTAHLDAVMLYGVTTYDDDFLVAGRSADFGVTLFSSTDGVRWGARPLTAPDVEAASQSVAVAEGTIVLTTSTEQGVVTSVSSDGGRTWERLVEGELRSVAVSGSALGFLGGTDATATVTLSDGDSFASAALDVAGPDRVALLNATPDQAVLLVQADGGGLTWVVAKR